MTEKVEPGEDQAEAEAEVEEKDELDWENRAFEAGRVFRPNTPISEKDLFAGRVDQMRRVLDAVNQEGQHAVIFGDRGVGKTSLANVLSQFFQGGVVLAPRVNCDGSDTFDRLWRKVFEQIEL